ncbi:MAG: type II secretion system F family protein [Candidatus Pacebacteria bacterium]|nr:type II secretion system F family protein [Candidatus Paceibacterota bacterium]
MLFNYRATTKEGIEQNGSIDAPNVDIAISSLQRRGLVILKINKESEGRGGLLGKSIAILSKVRTRDVVLLSRQIATLFEAKVSVLVTFRLLAAEAENPFLREALTAVTDDIKGGLPISTSLAKHPDIFSNFYVSMVKAGEESGKLSETFTFLADHLERSYELVTKAKNALIYPAFIVVTFIVVMILMLVFVIPKLSVILLETGQQLPIYTRLIIGFSNIFVDYGVIIVILLAILGLFLSRYLPTAAGNLALSRFKLSIPYVGRLYQKLYLARIADNLNTMITSGISMVRAVEVTAEVVDNDVYKEILLKSATAIKNGDSVSTTFAKYSEMPGILVQMIKVGEESGKLGFVLDTLARFYRREVNNEVDTLVGLIEPVMIVFLAVGVGILLTSVLVPIYNIASGI